MKFRPDPILCLTLLLAGCGPGSGGSGVPTGVGEPPSTSAPAPAPTTGAPAPAPAPTPVPACSASAGASAAAYQGEIEASEGGCLVVAGRAFVIEGAILVRRSGAEARPADLQPGVRVTIEPLASDPGRARVVVIEDLPG